jgi:hypothetical protein
MDPSCARLIACGALAIACTPADPPAARPLPPPELEPEDVVPAAPPTAVVPDAPAKVEPPPGIVPPPSVEPPPEEPAPPWVGASTVAGENWLVWSIRDGEPSTRWIVATSKTPRIAGERADIVVAEGDRMWRIEHARTEVPVYPCDCYDIDTNRRRPGCAASERVDRPSLRAIDLATQSATPIIDASGDPIVGNDVTFDLEIAGGVGAVLFVGTYDGGFFCGAHPIEESAFTVFDVAAAAPKPDALEQTLAALPEGVRRDGRAGTRTEIEDCFHDEASLGEALADPMFLAGVHVRLDAGQPTVTWEFQRRLPHVCAIDGAAHGPVDTGLLSEGAALGLSGPLPPAVSAALRDLGDADEIGWSRLDFEDTAARDALARFRGEDPPPPE